MRLLASRQWRWTSMQSLRRRGYSADTLQKHLLAPVQQYISTATDPYLNLSIEHYLLQNSPADTVVLFLYVNRPSIIIGRNQNPWYEVNLPLLTHPLDGNGKIDLVRRRSGGGSVFHDTGNVNWTVISPPSSFTRDKHAEMVVRALRKCGVDQARVNERHDIVMDQGSDRVSADDRNLYETAYRDGGKIRSLKVSGSAYKLTRGRALHHGTCLLSSPYLASIGSLLRSPLKPYIEARGVESVSSPVANIGLENDVFIKAVLAQFRNLYSANTDLTLLDETIAEVKEIAVGVSELKSLDWTFLQTPQFDLKVALDDVPAAIELTVRYGVITAARSRSDVKSGWHESDSLRGKTFHEVADWQALFKSAGWSTANEEHLDALGRWLQERLYQSRRELVS